MPAPQALACRLTTPALANRLEEIRQTLGKTALGIEVVADGYRLSLPNTSEQVQIATEFVRFEHECCPFLTFSLSVAPEDTPLTLDVTGPAEARDLLDQMFGSHMHRISHQ